MSRQTAHSKYNPDAIWPLFQMYLSRQVVEGWLKQCAQHFYQRVFLPWLVLWGFVYQRLNADHTCDAFVSYLNSDVNGWWNPIGKTMAENTSAYCQARKRLPLQLCKQALQTTAEQADGLVGAEGLWFDRQTYLLDGTTVRVQTSEELSDYYGHPKSQKGKSPWPVMRVMAAFQLWSGAIRQVAEGPHEASEYDLAAQLFRSMPAGVVWVADSMFSIYRMLQVIAFHQQDAVIRMQRKNVGKWIRKQPLQPNTECHLVWSPSKADCPDPQTPILAVPGRLIYVVIEQDGFRPQPIYLFTTLTDSERYPMAEIVRLYARRYGVELDLRHVKTTLDMEELDGKSIAMVRKELFLGLTAYNLIRLLMTEAALQTGVAPLLLSFARCWRRIKDTCLAIHSNSQRTTAHLEVIFDQLLLRLAQCRLPVRKTKRFEPRKVLYRPKPFPTLKVPRQEARYAILAQWRIS